MCRCERGRENKIREEKRAVVEGIMSFRAERKARKRRAGDRNMQDWRRRVTEPEEMKKDLE